MKLMEKLEEREKKKVIIGLESKPKNPSYPKASGVWIVKIIPTEIEVYPKDTEYIAHANTPFPINIFRGLVNYIGRI